MPAVRNGRVAVADGNKYFNRSSVASIQGTAEMVAEMIHPELRGMYGHHGTRWVRIGELEASNQSLGHQASELRVNMQDQAAQYESKVSMIVKRSIQV